MRIFNYNEMLVGIDQGIDAHLAWNQRLFRCALLHEPPGNDVLLPNAHELCQFGLWFNSQRMLLDEIDPYLTLRIEDSHRLMHGGVRSLAQAILDNRPAQAIDLQLYQNQQSTMITLLNMLRQQIVDIESRHDTLTGLPMRHGLEHAFSIRIRDALRTGQQLWLAIADIDHFKSVNDTHGHSIGDVAIKHIANRLSYCIRANDVLFRYGGEEFLALLLVEPGGAIHDLAKRMLTSACTPLMLGDGTTLQLSITLGLTPVSPDEALNNAIDRADFAMLDGKKAGRNRYNISFASDVIHGLQNVPAANTKKAPVSPEPKP